MNWAQITLLVLLGANLLFAAYKHGKPHDYDHDFWTTLISVALFLLLYSKAGLFN